jgi:nitroimidazol reductase NimA-like FMN-containing flavoprotein (pyridoxamine 5'-phosphate oxidase superfamily)
MNIAPMTREIDDLSRLEAIQLLAGGSLGRVGVTISALPAIFPVSYVVFDDSIVFRSVPGTKFAAAVSEAVVAFEVDDADPHATTGWSVLVVGKARPITDAALLEQVQELGLVPWAPGVHDDFVQIPLDIVTGRRIRASDGDGH